ncbi:MAG TPA: amidohydrolase [Bacteroidia bacterium]|nr:amidohydrolase [Bacteroidia bacterium]
MDIKEKIKQLSENYFSEIRAIRRHLHAHPELSFQEKNTADFIASTLTSIGIPFQKGIAGTGIVAILEGKNPKQKTIALRADMDALPILEENKTNYISQNKGVMHACGHDVHTASLLGTAKILFQLKDNFEGTVKFIFQPGEEKLPGGASLMIKEGVLENPTPFCIFAQHVFPSMETGKVGFKKGMYMASTDEIYLTIKGKGGHAAMPNDYNNPLLMASKILMALEEAFKNKKNNYPTVLAFGKIIGNGATNVIPAEVKIDGTLRTMDEKWRSEAHQQIKTIAQNAAAEMNGFCDVNIMKGYPFLVNDETLTGKAQHWAELFLGKENVEELPMRMTAEDFAFYSQKIPACFYRLGTGNKSKNIISGVHTPTFDIDEKALEIGMGLMAWMAINELAEK